MRKEGNGKFKLHKLPHTLYPMLHPSLEAAETVEDVGFYFRYLGGVQFGESAMSGERGHARRLAASSKFGVTIWCTAEGEGLSPYGPCAW